MQLEKSGKDDIIFENKSKEPNYIRYLVDLAILLFATIIGYNVFVAPDVDDIVKTIADSADFKEEKESLDKTKTNVNKAKKEELEKLGGIGEQRALKIIEYRETHGGFSSKKELMEVSGIGEKIFEKVKDQIIL